MRIGIDFRMAGTQYGGIGRYVLELTRHLLETSPIEDYYIFYNDDALGELDKLKDKGLKFKAIKTNIRHYSLFEQIKFPFVLNRQHLDLVHFPNFNVPIFYKKPFVVTIHDLIHHRLGGVKRTTLLHFIAYKKVIKNACMKAKKIITVSQASKADIVKEFNFTLSKIRVIYEGLSLKGAPTPKQITDFRAKFFLNKPYFLFVGIMQKNKNLRWLCEGFNRFLDKYKLDFDLVIAGRTDSHYPEIKNQCLQIKHSKNLVFTGQLEDDDLKAAYAGACTFVSASLYEGFGLPGVEAMGFGLPLAVSNIPVFNEIYENGAIYFEPENPESIAQCLNLLAQDRLYYMQVKAKALARSRVFNWEQAAKETLRIYEQAAPNGFAD